MVDKAQLEKQVLKQRSDIHLARRLYHSLGVCVILALFSLLPRPAMIYLFSSFTLLCLSLDIIRQKNSQLNSFLTKNFHYLIRENEVHNFTGMTYLTVGILTISIVFPPEIVRLSLLMLAFGDPLSSIFGILYGKDKLIGQKTLQGTVAGFVTCAVVSCIYFYYAEIFMERILLVSLICGFIGALSELIPIKNLDDNFTFPILSSCFLFTLFYFLGGF